MTKLQKMIAMFTLAFAVFLFAGCDVALESLTVRFNINGGTGTTPPAQTVPVGSYIILPNGSGITRSGFSFDGWNTNAAGTGDNFEGGYFFSVTRNVSLYARWAATRTVTFNSMGGTAVQAQQVPHGQTATRPADPTRDGFTFGNWYTNVNLTNLFDFATPITASITLRASWTQNAPVDPVGLTITGLPPPVGIAPYAVFIFAPGTNLSTPAIINNALNNRIAGGAVTGEGGVDFFTLAVWDSNHNVSLGRWEGTGSFPVILMDAFGDDNDARSPALRLATVPFTNGRGSIAFSSFTSVVNTFTVTFNSNGGSTVPNQTVDGGRTAIRPANPTRQLHAFRNWYSNAALTTPFNFASPVMNNINLFAGWNTIINLSYNNNRGSVEILSAPPNNVVLTATAFSGYEFAHWLVNGNIVENNQLNLSLSTVTNVHAAFIRRWVVSNPGDAANSATTLGTLRHAITNAQNDDIISFSQAMTVQLRTTLSVNRNIIIEGNGSTLTRSDGWTNTSSTSQLLRTYSTVTIRRVHFLGGRANTNGAGIHNRGNLTVESCIFSDNRIVPLSGHGGAIYNNSGATLIVLGSSFLNNHSTQGTLGGSAIFNTTAGGHLYFKGNLFYGNTFGSGIPSPTAVRNMPGNLPSLGFNVVNIPFGTTLPTQSGWVAVTGDTTFADLGISGVPVNTTTFEPVQGLRNVIPSRPANFPLYDFNGNPRTWPGAPGAVR